MPPVSVETATPRPEVISIATSEGQIIFVSAHVFEEWGYTVEQILDHNLFALLDLPSDPPSGTSQYTVYSPQGQPLSLTTTLSRATLANQLTYICSSRVIGSPVAPSPQPTPGIATYLTISSGDPLQQAEDNPTQSLALLMGQPGINSAAMIELVNTDHKIIVVNDRFCKVSGYSREELLGKTHCILQSGQHSPDFFRGIWATLQQGQIWEGEICHRHKNGSFYWVDSILIPFFQAGQGSPFQYLAISFDISERKTYETQLALSHEHMLEANRHKDEFLASMSHELRTPLNTILGMLQGLQGQIFGEINNRQQKALKAIELSGFQLLKLINDILDFSKMETGQISLDKRPLLMIPLCQTCVDLLKPQADQKQIQIAIQHPPALPEIYADERRIRQVLISLLSNAIKFTPPGGFIILSTAILSRRDPPPPANPGIVRVSIFRPKSPPPIPPMDPDHFLRLSVADTGIGIAAADQRHIFQPFLQLDSALNRGYPGTGLGLALVKRIVEQHGGEISLTSEVGAGSCFMVDLPVLAPSPSPSSPLPPSVARPPLTSSHVQPLIVLASDNASESNTFTSYLQAKGYRVIVAKEQDKTIPLTTQSLPQGILIDMSMSGANGLEPLHHLRRDPGLAKIPIIALIEPGRDTGREQCLAAGATDSLEKPVKLKQLVILLQQYLSPSEP
jgi:PAS domain S-box-containing protein